MKRAEGRYRTVIAALLPLAAGLSSCTPRFVQNQTAELTGNITVQIINNTPFRASFTFGTYNPLDRAPGPVDMQQLRLEARATSEILTLGCDRSAVIGTDEFIERAVAVNADETDDFDADAFSARVSFSSAPADSPAAALPISGTLAGVEALLGVHFGCEDRVIFTIEVDAAAPDGFRIDFTAIPAE